MFTGVPCDMYEVSVANYDGKVFEHWLDDPSNTNRTRTLTLTSNNVTLTSVCDIGDALRGISSLTYAGT